MAASHGSRRPVLRILAALLLAAAGSIAFFILSPFSGSSQSAVDQAALTYSQQQMVWSQGPSVQSTRILLLRDLSAALSASVPVHVRRDVNVPDLVRRFGSNRQVALVVLTGVYNTLPPDEGVVVRGQAVVLVDTRTDRGIYQNF